MSALKSRLSPPICEGCCVKFLPFLPALIALFSLQTFGASDSGYTQSSSRDYVITGHVFDGTCRISLRGGTEVINNGGSGELELPPLGLGSSKLSVEGSSFTNIVPAIGEMLNSRNVELRVDCPLSLAGVPVTVKLTTTEDVDSATHAIKNSSPDLPGDFGIKILDLNNNQDIDFTDATATSMALVPNTSHGSSEAAFLYQIGIVRYGDKIVDMVLSVPVVFNVAYE